MRLYVYQVHQHVPLRHQQQVRVRGAKVDGEGQACVQQQSFIPHLVCSLEKPGARHTQNHHLKSGLGVTVCVGEKCFKETEGQT
jgi:hypothetical protein